MKLYFFTVFILAIINHHNCQDISFPDDDDSDTYISGSKPIIKREAIKYNDQCPLNMRLYSTDKHGRILECDCLPKHAYFAKTDSCFEVFSRGPCPEHHYVYMATNESVPTCMKNPCRNDKFRPYNGNCYEFKAFGGPCKEDYMLAADDTTLKLDCVGENFFIVDIIYVPCRKNFRLYALGKCKRKIKT